MESKELILSFIRKIFISARIGIESNEFTEEEVNQLIANEAKKYQKEIMEMPHDFFMMFCIKEMLDELMAAKEGGK